MRGRALAEESDDPYVAAHGGAVSAYISAMTALRVGGRERHEAERDWQADWLAERSSSAADLCNEYLAEVDTADLDLFEPTPTEFWRVDGLDGLAPDLSPGGAHFYVARLGGEDAATLMAFDHDGDCGIYMVGTVPAARRGVSRPRSPPTPPPRPGSAAARRSACRRRRWRRASTRESGSVISGASMSSSPARVRDDPVARAAARPPGADRAADRPARRSPALLPRRSRPCRDRPLPGP